MNTRFKPSNEVLMFHCAGECDPLCGDVAGDDRFRAGYLAHGFALIAFERLDALHFSVIDTGTSGSHLGQNYRRSKLQPIFL